MPEQPPLVSPAARRRLLTTLLKSVSRAFYLSLRVLPAPLREPIALAYLLARAADTIADSDLLPPDRRLPRLRLFRAHLATHADDAALPPDLATLAHNRPPSAERDLLQSLPNIFALFYALNPTDRDRVRNVVLTLARGMQTDLTTFPPASSGKPAAPTASGRPNKITALQTERHLDDYTYLIAGCVGEFWTEMLIAYTPALSRWHPERMSPLGAKFGAALQLTNILRDAPQDLRLGRCYLPQTQLARCGLSPADLLAATDDDDAPDPAATRPLLAWGIRRALSNYAAAAEYILAIPRRCLRLRLAALWPALIGLSTLALLARHPRWLAASPPVKIPRRSVYAMIALSLLCARSDRALKFWLARLTRRVERALNSPPAQE